MFIEKVSTATEEVWGALQRLIPQLTTNHPPPSREFLANLLRSDSSILLIVRHPDEHGHIVGAANLTVYRVPTGIRAIIEDVIIDESARGQGFGAALLGRVLELAREAGAAGVTLTSNPKRVAANRLYQKLGFIKRDTNAYYLNFQQS